MDDVMLDILRAQGAFRPVGFIDNSDSLAGAEVCGIPVIGRFDGLARLRHVGVRHVVVAIGRNDLRVARGRAAEQLGFELVTAVHPTAFVSPRAVVGRGAVVAPNAGIVTDASIADLAIVNTGAVVDHECVIGEGAHVGPGAVLAGRVRIGYHTFVGVGARVIQCLSIGHSAMIGAGAVVIRDLPDYVTAVGVPARVINRGRPHATTT
jgi:UDP-perosamine 4-acetyltransferase